MPAFLASEASPASSKHAAARSVARAVGARRRRARPHWCCSLDDAGDPRDWRRQQGGGKLMLAKPTGSYRRPIFVGASLVLGSSATAALARSLRIFGTSRLREAGSARGHYAVSARGVTIAAGTWMVSKPSSYASASLPRNRASRQYIAALRPLDK